MNGQKIELTQKQKADAFNPAGIKSLSYEYIVYNGFGIHVAQSKDDVHNWMAAMAGIESGSKALPLLRSYGTKAEVLLAAKQMIRQTTKQQYE